MRTRMRKRICLLIALLPLLWGCRDLLAELAHQGEAVAQEGMVPVSVVLGDGSAPSRTIAPGHISQANLSGANFTLTGTSDMGGSISVQRFTLRNGVGTLNLSPGNWRLELVYGTATVDMLRGGGTVEVADKPVSVSITLTPVATGTGTLNLTVNWNAQDRTLLQSDTSKGRHVRVGLFHPGTETLVAGTTAAEWNRDPGHSGTINLGLTYLGLNGGGTPQIAVGKYELRFWMWGGGIPDGVKLVWRDTLYIEPGRETRATVTIPQLARLPGTPTGFAESCTAFNGNGEYTATLSWGGVYNAERYELEVMKYTTGTVLPTSDQTWTSASGQASSAVYRYTAEAGSPERYTNPAHSGTAVMRHVSGGLLGGQDTIAYRMRLSSGEGYAARMRTVNSYGSSVWAYLASPMVPDLPYFPTSFSGEAGEMRAGDKFYADFKWKRGIVDANGTYELELLAFTGGTKPTNEATWNAAQGRATYSHRTGFAAAGTPAALVSGVGGLGPDDESVQLDITGTTTYYTARLRAVNSGGGASDWLYIPEILLPQPVYSNAVTTRADYQRWSNQLGSMQWVWDVTMHIYGPKIGTTYRTSWVRCVRGNFAEALDNDVRFEEMAGYSENYGSNLNGTVSVGSATETRREMNNGSPFIFRIRVETPYGNTPWWYWPQEVRQLP